jgi:circadian clock protein KaiC
MERVSFGIRNFDSMIEGGLPRDSIVGMAGPPGVGKSIFTLHYLLEGAKAGEKGLYINLEEPRKNIDNMLDRLKFGDQFRKFEKKGLIVIKCMTYTEYERIFLELFKKINEDAQVKRLAIDSFNVFFISAVSGGVTDLSQEINVRRMINQIFTYLRKDGLTTLLILEKHSSRENAFLYNIPYLLDGMISLDFLELGTVERRVFIPKMRWTNQYKESKAYSVGKSGIQIIEG